MNAASIESSDRLNRVLDLLSQGSEFTTLDIIKEANVCAVNSIISELRQNGFDIACQRRADKWFYKLGKVAQTSQT
jgi:hypothetical protein